MNILHLEDEPWDSGLAHYALTIAAKQKQMGHQVSLWGQENSPILAQAADLGLETVGWPKHINSLIINPSFKKKLLSLNPTIINAHTGSSHFKALLFSPPRSVVIRTRADARPPRSTILTRLQASKTNAFIAANSHIKRHLEQSFPSRPCFLVEQGIDGPKNPLPLPVENTIGLLARMDRVKGHDYVIDALKLFDKNKFDFKVIFAGKGKELERLKKRVHDEGLDRFISFPGYVDDRWSFISKCRWGLVPSVSSEAVSRAALEWMAAGRAIIATQVGGLPDIVRDGKTGILIPPANATILAQAFVSLLSNSTKAAEMALAARERWQTHHSLNVFYLNTQRTYETTLNSLSHQH